MSSTWVREEQPAWDSDKERIVGAAPEGAFDLAPYRTDEPLPGAWWRLEDDDGAALAYGWMDIVWGDAEMLLAVDPAHHGRGLGTLVLDHLDAEAARRGLNYLSNVVRPAHPDRERVTAWLCARGFRSSSDGILRRKVRSPQPGR